MAAVVLVSSAVQSATGFGFSIVAVPFLVIILGVRDGVVVNLVLSMLANAAVTARVRRECATKIAGPMVAGALIGCVPGMLLLHFADVRLLKVFIAAIVTLVAVVLLAGVPVRFRQRRSSSVATGVTSGFLGGSTGLAGPPLTVYLGGLGLGKARYRATMAGYFTMLNVVLVPAQVIASGSYGLVLWSLLFLPAVAVGAWCGEHVFNRLGEGPFIRAVTIVVLAAGLGGLALSSF